MNTTITTMELEKATERIIEAKVQDSTGYLHLLFRY